MKIKIFLLFIVVSCFGCADKLDLKPNSLVVLPKTIKDFEMLLDNFDLTYTPSLSIVSADEYFIPKQLDWQSLSTVTSRNASIWSREFYGGDKSIYDWTIPYKSVFYANNVLETIVINNSNNLNDVNRIKGWALFIRAYSFYNLVSLFSKAYIPESATSDLGIPLKINAAIDVIVPRSTVQQTYDQIIKDALDAAELLPREVVANKKTRPSKVAAYAFLARVYLSMRKYEQAELYADKALAVYSNLTDFNSLEKTSATPFTNNSEEIIYFSRVFLSCYELTAADMVTTYGINQELIDLYDPSDIRLQVYFQKNTIGNYNLKPINNIDVSPFSGLATDEVYLIKAECLARRAETSQSMELLNRLVSKRWDPNATIPSKLYQNIIALSPQDALNEILLERRKSLVYRGVRWTDLKRLNLEGRNITITRNVGDLNYSLEPNSIKYVLPIPDDEVALSGIQQNKR